MYTEVTLWADTQAWDRGLPGLGGGQAGRRWDGVGTPCSCDGAGSSPEAASGQQWPIPPLGSGPLSALDPLPPIQAGFKLAASASATPRSSWVLRTLPHSV